MKKKEGEIIPVAANRKALYDYRVLETYEAGLSLFGPEVKSLRQKAVRLQGSFVLAENGEAFIHNLHISPYAFNHVTSPEPERVRKLLLKRSEIKRLSSEVSLKGRAIIPLEIFFKHGWAKVTLALAEGKKSPDKREDIKKKDVARQLRREFKGKFRG